MPDRERYIPALGHNWLTPLYDPLQRWIMREERFKRQLLLQARIEPGHHVLDLGCGTGTLTIMIKRQHPQARVVALDGDGRALAIARAKAASAGVQIAFDIGMSFQLPYPDQTFDRVLSSLMFHHLTPENKRRTAREIARVLRPGGELHLVDLGLPHSTLAYLISLFTRQFEETTDNVEGRLPEIFRAAGLDPVEETGWHMSVAGSLSLYQAGRPAVLFHAPPADLRVPHG